MNRILLLLLFCCTCSAAAQVELVEAHGLVGEQVRMPIVLRGTGGEVVVRGVLALGNPTVFYPERFVEVRTGALLSSHLSRLTDSTWSVELRLRYQPGDTVCSLVGEALAGSASQCSLVLQDIEADAMPWPDAAGVVSVTSIGTPLPYVRFARLEPNFPNPAVRGQTTTWVYRIDKASDVRIVLYNLGGRTVDVLSFGVQKPGVYRVPYRVSGQMATGLYWAQLVTASGLSSQPFVVVP